MTPFLMLFAGVRELHAEKVALISDVARLTGEAEAARARADELARHNEDLKRVVDTFSHLATRRNVFARSEAPEAAAVPEVIPVPRRQFARDVRDQRTREALQKQREYLSNSFQAESAITEAESA